MQNNSIKGHMAAFSANAIYGISVIINKSLFTAGWMTPLGIIFVRFGFGILFFWTMSFFTAKEKVERKDFLMIAAGGVIGLVVTQAAYYSALKLTAPIFMSLISSMTPIIVLLLSAIFLRDPISFKKAVGVIIGISGATLVILKKGSAGTSSSTFIGITLAMINLVSYSAYLVMIRKVSIKYHPVTVMKWMFVWAFIFAIPLCITELPKQRLFSSEATILPVLQLGYVLFLTCALGLFLVTIALKCTKATTYSMYMNMQPLIASFAAIAIGQDFFSWDKLLALVLIVSGVILVTQTKERF